MSPAAKVKAQGVEVARERVLSDSELKAIWEACDKQGWPFGPFVKMLIVTAQRLREVSHMRWEDIHDGVWTLPRDITKPNRTHEVPLSPLALELLEGAPRLGDYVFMSGRTDRPISGFSQTKKRLDAVSGVSDWRYHDLRRTAGTNMARSGIAVSTISRVLNHKEGGVTAIYNRYSYLDEKRHALATWARRLTEIVYSSDHVVVVEMR